MNGLKVYLKSKVGAVYHYAQLACMLLLLLNGILQLEWVHAPFEVVGINFLGAAVLLVGFFLPYRVRKRYRLLPGLLIALGGFAMYLTTRGETQWVDGYWPNLIYGTGIGAMALGLSQTVLDVRGWVKLSPRSLRIKQGLLPQRRIEWAKVKDLFVEDGCLHVVQKSSRTLVLPLSQGNSQTINSRIDQLFREARAFQADIAEDGMTGARP
jgi:hypothetical protein